MLVFYEGEWGDIRGTFSAGRSCGACRGAGAWGAGIKAPGAAHVPYPPARCHEGRAAQPGNKDERTEEGE